VRRVRAGMSATEILPAIRDLHSRHPEMRYLEAWELQSALCVLGYADELLPEWGIAAATDVACQDWPEWRRAA
jgi:hypothetical protein